MTIVSQIELAIEFDYNDDLPALLLNWTQAPQISGANLSMDAANRRQSAIRNAISRIKNTSNSPEQELVVLEALRADGYSYVTTFMVPDYTRMRHAELAADRGDFETVELLFKEVQHPQFMMNAQLNKVFSEVVNTPEFEHWRDIRARYEDWGQFWMEKSKNNPERLEPIYNLIGAYARLGQNAKAKNVILSVLAEIDAGESSYTDQYRYENWFRDDYATLLYREGQVEEAFIQMRRGIGAGENGGANVSQVLNLALAQCQSGDPQKALTTLQIASPDRMSDYGRMVRSSIEVCIYSQLGDEAKVEHAIEYLETNSLDSWENLLTAYLFADRQPSAIKLLSEKLRSEKERSNALWHVQILEGDNDNYQSEFQELIETRKQAVIADPRVQSAIKQAGLRKRWPIASLY